MNRKQLPPCGRNEIQVLSRKLAQRLAPGNMQKTYEKTDEVWESFNSRKLKAWHMVQEAGATGDLRTLKMIDKLTVQYDIADFMERTHRNDILEENENEADV